MFSPVSHESLLELLNFFDVPMFAAERAAANDYFRMIGVNAAHSAATSLTTDMVKGKTPADLLSAADALNVSGHYQACVNHGKTIVYYETVNLFGMESHWRTTLQPVYLENGAERVIGTAVQLHNVDDITGFQDTAYFAAQAQIKIGQLEAFLSHLEQRVDLPSELQEQAMMVAGLTRSLDAILSEIQAANKRQFHRLPQRNQVLVKST